MCVQYVLVMSGPLHRDGWYAIRMVARPLSRREEESTPSTLMVGTEQARLVHHVGLAMMTTPQWCQVHQCPPPLQNAT